MVYWKHTHASPPSKTTPRGQHGPGGCLDLLHAAGNHPADKVLTTTLLICFLLTIHLADNVLTTIRLITC